MRVLFIPSGDDKYGAPKSMMELVENLKRRYGIEAIVMTCTNGLINQWCTENEIENYVLGQGSFMVVGGSNRFRKIVKHGIYPFLRFQYLKEDRKAKRKIEEILKGKKIDLVHTNVNRIDIGGYYAMAHNIPHIWHLREFGKEDYNCMYLRPDAISFMNRSATKFVAISEAVKTAWSKKGLDKNKTEVIYNGLDLFAYSIELPERINQKTDMVRIVFAGIISETKGQIFLIKAIERLSPEARKKIKVDFYGGGRKAYIRQLQRYVKKKELNSFIEFRGYCSSIPAILPQYDIGVVASRAEAFGRVTVEYMASGLCVIASDTGANTEIIKHKENGLIYQYGNANALAKCMEAMIKNKNRMKTIRMNAFGSVRDRYTMDRCADEVYQLYQNVLEKKE